MISELLLCAILIKGIMSRDFWQSIDSPEGPRLLSFSIFQSEKTKSSKSLGTAIFINFNKSRIELGKFLIAC
jgi:hypothetical protein